MQAAPRLAAGGFYPERGEEPESAFDRLAGTLGFRWRALAARRLGDQAARNAAVRAHAAGLRDQPLAGCLPGLRYRLRRDEFHPDVVAECHGAVFAALERLGAGAPPPHVLGAADRLVKGGIAELAEPGERVMALTLAAAAFAAHGAPVHVLAASDARAASLADALRAPLAELGLAVAGVAPGMALAARRDAYAAPVVCASWREVALNYLQDQLGMKRAHRRLSGRVVRSGGGHLLRGLGCALVDDADAVLVDDAASPAVIAAEADRSGERLVYEQALELARSLAEGRDFSLVEDGARLSPAAEQSIARFLAPLGGAWAAAGRRRQLIETALDALHLMVLERDYRFDNDQLVLQEAAEEVDAAAQDLHGMIELKEGRRLSARRDVLARLPALRFLRRYVHLAGVCPDARGIEAVLWSLYRLDTTQCGERAKRPPLPVRVFATAAEKRLAVAKAARDATAAGQAVVVAASSLTEAQALAAAGVAADQLSLHPAEARVARRAEGPPLCLLVAETHDAARHVERLRDTYGAASGELVLSLEDDALAGSALAPLLGRRPRRIAALAQRRAASAASLAREEALAREQMLADLLAFSGAAG